jgi:hypothetical protein
MLTDRELRVGIKDLYDSGMVHTRGTLFEDGTKELDPVEVLDRGKKPKSCCAVGAGLLVLKEKGELGSVEGGPFNETLYTACDRVAGALGFPTPGAATRYNNKGGLERVLKRIEYLNLQK